MPTEGENGWKRTLERHLDWFNVGIAALFVVIVAFGVFVFGTIWLADTVGEAYARAPEWVRTAITAVVIVGAAVFVGSRLKPEGFQDD